jgi:2'-5' RNA ligase
MSDIVERLHKVDCFYKTDCTIRKEAADEIKRMREALQNCATVLEMESDTYTEDNFTPHARLCRTAVSMARAALGEGKE